jgi:ankyrin repeat protein
MNEVNSILHNYLSERLWRRRTPAPVIHEPEVMGRIRSVNEAAIVNLSHRKALQHSLIAMGIRGEALVDVSRNGDKESLIRLLEGGPIFDRHRGEAIAYAAQRDRVDVVRVLLGSGRIFDEDLGKAMVSAAERGHIAIVQLLLATEYIPFTFMDHLNTAVEKASMMGHLAVVKLLLEDTDTTISDESQGKAMVLAARFGHSAIVELLLQNDWISEEYQVEAMRSAAGSGSLEIVKLFLRNDRTFSAQDLGLAMECAGMSGYLEIVRALLATGRIPDESRRWVILVATTHGYSQIVELLSREEKNLQENLPLEILSWFQLFDRAFLDKNSQIPEISKKGEFDTVMSKLIKSLNDNEKLLLLNYLRNDPDDVLAISLRSTAEFQADGQSRASLALRVIRMIFLASEDDSFRQSMLNCIAAGRGACGDRLLWSFNDIEVEGNLCRCRKLGDQAFAEMAARAQRYELVKQKGEKLANDLGNEHEAVETVLYLFIHLSDPLNLPISTKHMAHPRCSRMNDDYVSQVQTELEAIKTVDLLAQSEPWRQYLKTQYPSAEKAFEWVETIYTDQVVLLDSSMKDSEYQEELKSIKANRERDLYILTKEWTMKLQKEQGLLLN